MPLIPKPLLLLDVDGVLNPFRLITKKGYLPPKQRPGEEPFTYVKHRMTPAGWEDSIFVEQGVAPKQLPVLLSAEMGAMLADLQDRFTLIWATTWQEEANKWLSPILGLPNLPVIEWPSEDTRYEWAIGRGSHRGSWKSKWIARWLDEYAVYRDDAGALTPIPWVWVDDEVNQHDRAYFRRHYGEDRKDAMVVDRWLLRVEPSHGLRRHDFDKLAEWADLLTGKTPVG